MRSHSAAKASVPVALRCAAALTLLLICPAAATLRFAADARYPSKDGADVPSYVGRYIGLQEGFPPTTLAAVPYNPELDAPACFNACNPKPARPHNATSLVVYTIGLEGAECNRYSALLNVKSSKAANSVEVFRAGFEDSFGVLMDDYRQHLVRTPSVFNQMRIQRVRKSDGQALFEAMGCIRKNRESLPTDCEWALPEGGSYRAVVAEFSEDPWPVVCVLSTICSVLFLLSRISNQQCLIPFV